MLWCSRSQLPMLSVNSESSGHSWTHHIKILHEIEWLENCRRTHRYHFRFCSDWNSSSDADKAKPVLIRSSHLFVYKKSIRLFICFTNFLVSNSLSDFMQAQVTHKHTPPVPITRLGRPTECIIHTNCVERAAVLLFGHFSSRQIWIK